MKPTVSSDNTVRAAVYLRISLDQEDDRKGVFRQEVYNRAVVAERGWQVVEPSLLSSSADDEGPFRRVAGADPVSWSADISDRRPCSVALADEQATAIPVAAAVDGQGD
jgi:hypothetical protein